MSECLAVSMIDLLHENSNQASQAEERGRCSTRQSRRNGEIQGNNKERTCSDGAKSGGGEMGKAYENFLASKRISAEAVGIEPREITTGLFPFQQDIVRWALRRGRAAMFENCGLGKTVQQLEWARQIFAGWVR